MNFRKINCSDIAIGVRFSAPVFFDDGVNMFLAEGKSAKPYHLATLKRWKVPYLLTYGHIMHDFDPQGTNKVDDEDVEELEVLEEVDDDEVEGELEPLD